MFFLSVFFVQVCKFTDIKEKFYNNVSNIPLFYANTLLSVLCQVTILNM